VFREHILLVLFKAADEFCNPGRPRWKKYRQLCASVSTGAPVSTVEPVSVDGLYLAQLRRRTIGCQWRAWGAQESPTWGKTKNI
jgi:hypothetical protein